MLEATGAGFLGQRVFAILRSADPSRVADAIDVIVGAGIRTVEVTFTTPDADRAISKARERHPDGAWIGAGTVVEPDDVRRAVGCGASFCVSPVTDRGMVEACVAEGVPAVPGTYTPTEMLLAHRLGAVACKVFPSRPEGVSFVRQVLAPLPYLKLVPTGGVTIDDVPAYLEAGAVAVGLGTALLEDALDGGDLDRLADRCRRALSAAGAEGVA